MFVCNESGVYVNLDRCDWVEVVEVAGANPREYVVACGVYSLPKSPGELRHSRTLSILRTCPTEAEAESYLRSLFTRNRFHFPEEPSCN